MACRNPPTIASTGNFAAREVLFYKRKADNCQTLCAHGKWAYETASNPTQGAIAEFTYHGTALLTEDFAMRLRNTATTSLLVTALVIAGGGFVHASPAPQANPVGFKVVRVDDAVVTTLQNGSFQFDDTTNSIAIKDNSGATLETLPLSYTLNGRRYPLRRQLSGDNRILRLTPLADQGTTQLTAVASDLENSRAQQNFMTQLSAATTVGSVVGTIIGAILGGAAGVVVALASCVALLACILIGAPIFVTLASVGGVAGTVLAGGGALVTAGWDYVQTLQARPNTTHWR